jgi:hypothetical protein
MMRNDTRLLGKLNAGSRGRADSRGLLHSATVLQWPARRDASHLEGGFETLPDRRQWWRVSIAQCVLRRHWKPKEACRRADHESCKSSRTTGVRAEKAHDAGIALTHAGAPNHHRRSELVRPTPTRPPCRRRPNTSLNRNRECECTGVGVDPRTSRGLCRRR